MFKRLLQTVFAGLERKSCFVYIDDILVCSKSFEEHLKHMQEIFERWRKVRLTLKPKKCSFLQKHVIYLGHVISSDEISPDPSKIQSTRLFCTNRCKQSKAISWISIIILLSLIHSWLCKDCQSTSVTSLSVQERRRV